jgi:hypothetical protein|nr:MAG TPA: hypothetical protein [Caudoviricetes sp.]
MRSNAWWDTDRFAKEYMKRLSWNGPIDAVDAALYAKKKMQELERGSKMDRDICKEIKNVKFNPPATIVFWTDNTKTVVKCNGEDYDPEKGLAMCICKKVLGNKGYYYNVFKKWLPKEDESNSIRDVLRNIKPKTFTFELKPIDVNQKLFSVLTGAFSGATIEFDEAEEKPELHSCDTCALYDKDSGCVIGKDCIDFNKWTPKNE